MTKLKTILATCTFLTALAAVAVAQTAEAAKPTLMTTPLATAGSEISVAGKVISSTTTELVIETDAGTRMTFALDTNTYHATAFNNGERVTVQYHSLSGGTVFHAARIGVETSPIVASPMAERQVDEVASTYPSRLPDTASRLPLIGLLGLLAAGGAVAVRVVRS